MPPEVNFIPGSGKNRFRSQYKWLRKRFLPPEAVKTASGVCINDSGSSLIAFGSVFYLRKRFYCFQKSLYQSLQNLFFFKPRLPSTPCQTSANDVGYQFHDERHIQASYLTAMEIAAQIGMLTSKSASYSASKSIFLPPNIYWSLTIVNFYIYIIQTRTVHQFPKTVGITRTFIYRSSSAHPLQKMSTGTI